MKKLLFRKIIENVCHLMGHLPHQLAQWDKVNANLSVFGKSIKCENIDSMQLLERRV